MLPLRNHGVYRPPGLRPVFAVHAGGAYLLYDREYGLLLPPRYTVWTDGCVSSWHSGRVDWTAADLVDTGETCDPEGILAAPGATA